MASTSTRVSRPEEEGVKRLVAMAGERDSGETCNDQLGHMEILLDSVEFDLNLPPELLYGIRHGQTLSAAPSKGSQYKSPTATYNRMDTGHTICVSSLD